MDPVFLLPSPVLVPMVGGGAFPVRRIYCVGRNYADHAREMGYSGREAPFFFMKPGDAAVPVAEGQEGRVSYPSLTSNLHHEVELVVAIGRGGRDIPVADATGHILGHAVGLDLTRRDLQAAMKADGRPWDIAKGFDESAPIGPITPAGAGLAADAAIALRVNGELRQSGRISDMIWSVGEIVSQLSAAWTLSPGDLVFTGTPEGVGALVRGDRLEATVEGLAPLRVRID